MKQEPKFEWDEESGVAVCVLNDGINDFVGIAQCHEHDQDMKSEKTGCSIALARAQIKYYSHIKNNELKIAIQTLKHLYSTMYHSKQFNENSYENKSLQRELKNKENDLAVVNEIIIKLRKELKEMIDEKDKFYKQVRKIRGIKS